MTRLVGDKELKRTLQRLTGAVRESAQLGLQEAADLVVDEAKDLVHVQTGELREGIHSEVEKSTRDEIAIAAGPDASVDHAEEQEFGSDHNWPHPYMRPAIDEKSAAGLERIEQRVRGGLKSVAK